MTMHLIQGVNTSRTRKRKPKMTKANIARWTEECRLYNREQKQCGMPKVSVDEYIQIIHGLKPKPKNNTYDTFKELDVSPRYRTSGTEHIPSRFSGGSANSCSKKEPMRYTGTLIKGISTMHKSNAVPIIDEREAKEHASMRR